MKWNVFFKRRLTAMTCRAYKALVRLTAVAAVVLTAAGCSGRYNYPRELLTADSLAEVDADSAVAFLRQMEPRMCHEPEPVHRYYQLLTIKAADKAYIPHTSDSLILTLVDYYENGGDKEILPLAYYYAGRIYHDMNRFPDALTYYQKARQILEEADEHRLLAKTNSQIGFILTDLNLEDEAIKYINEAKRIDMLTGNDKSLIYNLRDLANIYRTKHDYENALKHYTDAYQKALAISDTIMTREMEAQLADVHFVLGDTLQALRLIRKSLQQVAFNDTLCVYAIAVDIYGGLGLIDSTELFAKGLLSQDDYRAKEQACMHLLNIAKQRNDTTNLYSYLKLYREYNDSAITKKNADAVAKLLVLYDYNQKEQEVYALEKKVTNRNVWVGAILVIVVIVSYIAYRQWRRHKQWQMRTTANLMAYQRYVEAQLRQPPKTHLEPSKQAIDSQKIIESSDIYATVQSCRASGMPIAMTDVDWKLMVETINEAYPQFVYRLYQACPHIKQHGFRVSIAIKFGLKPKEIAEATNRSPQAISSTRSRLFKDTTGKSGTASEWDEFLNSL